MTIFFPDLSHYDMDRALQIEPETVAVIVKATHGAVFLDRGYSYYRRQASEHNAYFTAYHWLNHGNAARQAEYCYAMIGAEAVMVDVEDTPANDGWNGAPTVDDIITFANRYRELGGQCHLAYIPRWYWESWMGSPDLRPLEQNHIYLVASNYTMYSDDGPGWQSYGGVTPVQWQYTSRLPYGGSTCDFNAFKGTLEEYKKLTKGTLMSDWSGLGAPKNFPYSGDVASADVQTVLRTGDKTGWSDIDGAGWFITRILRDIRDRVAGLSTPTVTLTDADRAAITEGIVNGLLAKLTLVQKS